MKNLMIIAVLATMTINANAFNVSRKKIKKVNAYIAKTIAAETGTTDPDFTVEVTKAKTKLLSKTLKEIEVEADYQEKVTVSANVKANSKKVELEASAEYLANQTELTFVNANLPFVEEFLKAYKSNDKFNLSLTAVTNEEGRSLKLLVTPTKSNEALEESSLELFVPKTAGKLITAKANVAANALNETVKKAQTAITNIFNSLVNEEAPKETDLEALAEVVDTVLASL